MFKICKVIVFLVLISTMVAWGTMALYYSCDTALLGIPGAVIFPLSSAGALLLIRSKKKALLIFAVLFAIVILVWSSNAPSNDRNWQPDVARLAHATMQEEKITVHNIRNLEYRSDYVLRLVKKIVTLPINLLQTTAHLVTLATRYGFGEPGDGSHIRTSLDSMSPKNPGLLALAEMPLAQGIKGHSIIAIKGDETPPEGHDGVVAYKSAHVTYVESEYVVRSEHSSQGHPLVIEEVRRILVKIKCNSK